MNQAEIQSQLGFKRNTWSNWETGVTEPNIETLVKISDFFKISLSDLVQRDLAKGNLMEKSEDEQKGNLIGNGNGNLTGKNYQENTQLTVTGEPEADKDKKYRLSMPRVVVVDNSGEENILFVPVKARAGYLLGYGDPEFIEKLPAFKLPGFTNGTYRLFEIDGNSMFNTLHDHDRVIARWERVSDIKDDRVYVLVTVNDGVVIKRIINRHQEGILICKSDNNHAGEYPPLIIHVHDILEVWYVVEAWSRQLSRPGEVYKRLVKVEADIELLKHSLNR